MELKDLKEPYKTLLEKLVEALKKRYGDRFISLVIFGSIARGEMRRDSDVDLLLIIDSISKPRLERQGEFMEVEGEIEDYLNVLLAEGYCIDFSPIIKTPEEAMRISPLYLDMVEDAVILYDRDGFFKNILERLRSRLRELGSKRIELGKRWYWVLKPDYRFGEVIEIE
ncbi:MAG: nucleotidyltransferase domain-containing protein [Methanocellales archaeon]